MTDEKMPRRVWVLSDKWGIQLVRESVPDVEYWNRHTPEDYPHVASEYILATDYDRLRELARAVVEARGLPDAVEHILALRDHLDATEKGDAR